MLLAEPHLPRLPGVFELILEKLDALRMLARPSKPAGLDKLFRQIHRARLAHAQLAPFGHAAVEHVPASAAKANFAHRDDFVLPMSSGPDRNWLVNWHTAQRVAQWEQLAGWENSELEILGPAAKK